MWAEQVQEQVLVLVPALPLDEESDVEGLRQQQDAQSAPAQSAPAQSAPAQSAPAQPGVASDEVLQEQSQA